MKIPKISLRGVTKSFGTKKVLQGIDLDVAALINQERESRNLDTMGSGS